jgi:uncharacterized protein YvpB
MKRLDVFTVLLALILWVIPILPAQASELPGQAFVSGVIGHAQSYSLSCESRSAADWAAFWGVDISEGEFLNALPRSSNPKEGFVGNPNDDWGYTPPYSYGVHAAPVAKLLRQYGLDAHAGTGLSWEEIRAEVAAGRPVIVWVIGSIWSGTAKEYRPSDNESAIVAAFEHTMILVGYDDNQVHLVDAFTGLTISHKIDNFLTSWSVLGNMAVIGSGAFDSDEADATSNEPVDQNIYVIQPGDTLSKLAARWDISWQEIAAANQISYPYTLLPGQELSMQAQRNAIPESEGIVHKGEIRLVQPGEHLMQIARELDMEWEELADFNELQSPYLLFPGDIIYLPGESSETDSVARLNPADLPASYTAARHESLYALAYRYELNWTELATLNNLSFPYMLYPGQELQLQK